MAKYHNKKISNELGEFDSRLEFKRYEFLLGLESEGIIRNIRRQVSYELIPKQTHTEQVHLKTKVKYKEVLDERPVRYLADFVYERIDTALPYEVVEDCKGASYRNGRFTTMTPDFILKRKLMLYRHNIKVKIITKATDWD